MTTILDLVAAELAWAIDAAEAFRLALRALDAALSENLWPSAGDRSDPNDEDRGVTVGWVAGHRRDLVVGAVVEDVVAGE